LPAEHPRSGFWRRRATDEGGAWYGPAHPRLRPVRPMSTCPVHGDRSQPPAQSSSAVCWESSTVILQCQVLAYAVIGLLVHVKQYDSVKYCRFSGPHTEDPKMLERTQRFIAIKELSRNEASKRTGLLGKNELARLRAALVAPPRPPRPAPELLTQPA
jgi:hypothetical protein